MHRTDRRRILAVLGVGFLLPMLGYLEARAHQHVIRHEFLRSFERLLNGNRPVVTVSLPAGPVHYKPDACRDRFEDQDC